ncbi:MAG: formate--tetrahydrofolate ligase, partial [Planctomycetota bacterium]
MSFPSLDVLAARLGLEPGEWRYVGAGRAAVEPTAGPGRRQGRWVLAVEGPRSPFARRRSTSAVALAEAFHAQGQRAIATLALPTLAEALSGRAVSGLDLDLEGRLRPSPAPGALVDAAALLENLNAHEGFARETSFVTELADIALLARDEREFVAALGRTTLGRRADGGLSSLASTAALPSVVALAAPALAPVLARTLGGCAALLSPAGLGTASVAATRVALGAAEVVVARAESVGAARHALELIGARAGARASAAVLFTDIFGLRYASGRLRDVRASELERVLAADDAGLAEAGLATLVERARTLADLGVPVVVALEDHGPRQDDELASLVAALEACG